MIRGLGARCNCRSLSSGPVGWVDAYVGQLMLQGLQHVRVALPIMRDGTANGPDVLPVVCCRRAWRRGYWTPALRTCKRRLSNGTNCGTGKRRRLSKPVCSRCARAMGSCHHLTILGRPFTPQGQLVAPEEGGLGRGGVLYGPGNGSPAMDARGRRFSLRQNWTPRHGFACSHQVGNVWSQCA